MYNIIYRYIIIIAYKKFILILLLQKSLNIMKIIDLLFVNTFKQHVQCHDQCQITINVILYGYAIEARPLLLQIYPFNDFFFLNARTFEREQMA